jgi:hypothetical protein
MMLAAPWPGWTHADSWTVLHKTLAALETGPDTQERRLIAQVFQDHLRFMQTVGEHAGRIEQSPDKVAYFCRPEMEEAVAGLMASFIGSQALASAGLLVPEPHPVVMHGLLATCPGFSVATFAPFDDATPLQLAFVALARGRERATDPLMVEYLSAAMSKLLLLRYDLSLEAADGLTYGRLLGVVLTELAASLFWQDSLAPNAPRKYIQIAHDVFQTSRLGIPAPLRSYCCVVRGVLVLARGGGCLCRSHGPLPLCRRLSNAPNST